MKRMVTEKEIGEVAVDSVSEAIESGEIDIKPNAEYAIFGNLNGSVTKSDGYSFYRFQLPDYFVGRGSATLYLRAMITSKAGTTTKEQFFVDWGLSRGEIYTPNSPSLGQAKTLLLTDYVQDELVVEVEGDEAYLSFAIYGNTQDDDGNAALLDGIIVLVLYN